MIRKLIGKLFGGSKKKTESSSAHSSSLAHGHTKRGAAHGSGSHGGKPGDKRRDPAHPHGQKLHARPEHRPHGTAPARPEGEAPREREPRRGSHGGHGASHGGGHGPAQPRREHASGDSFQGESREGGERRRRSRGGRGRGRSGGPQGDRRDRQRDDFSESAPLSEEQKAAQAAISEIQPEPVASTAPIDIPAIAEDNEFTGLGLEPFIVAAIDAMGYQQPTPIQSEAIPVVLAGRDVIGSAQTGTGKTAAFGLPILQKLKSHGKLRCLVLEPTRELAVQVDEAFQTFKKFTNLRAHVIFGGVGYGPQREAIARGLDIVVATPGRLLDHLEQRSFNLDDIQFLVLDEVDRMLDMGFLPDVKRIIEKCPKDRQTLFFSATIPPELAKLTSWCLRDPHTIEIGRRRSPAETVSHAFYPVIESQKFALLKQLLEQTNYESVIIFCRTKHGADFVGNRLLQLNHKVTVMHSNRSQGERMEALKGFKSGKYEVLVATDVAARGLDIAGVSHVINYDTPQHAEDYVHRIGRTGRAQNEGDAFTLLTEEESKYAHSIERFIGQKVERKKIEGFDYQYSAVFASQEEGAKNVFRSRLYRGTRK
jgi:ATP-dependent RNA helicase RhlE